MPKPSSLSLAPARRAAFDTLLAVENGAFASDELRLRSAALSSRDAALASQIVFGSLRFEAQLDFLIARYSGRKTSSLDAEVRAVLRAAIFQLRHLDRIPAYAAVHDSVEFIKLKRRAASGLVNAVLRKVNADPVAFPEPSVALSCPEWLLRRWQAAFGDAAARGIASAALSEPLHYIRVSPGAVVPPLLDLEPTGISGCFRVLSGSPATPLRFHDIGAQSIVPLLDLQAGLAFLDLCAAPGNKTAQAMETPLRRVVACDIAFDRLSTIAARSDLIVLDAAQPLPFSSRFDRILVDAPCSGTGTLARNPEIKWRLRPSALPRFHKKQARILENALAVLAPTGKLVYSTCSLEHEENEDVVDEVLRKFPRWRVERSLYRIPGRDPGDGFFAAVIVASDS